MHSQVIVLVRIVECERFLKFFERFRIQISFTSNVEFKRIMDIANEEGTIATTPTRYSTELSSSIGESGAQFRSTDFPNAYTPSLLATRPPPSVSDNVDVNPSHNSHDGIYEIDVRFISCPWMRLKNIEG